MCRARIYAQSHARLGGKPRIHRSAEVACRRADCKPGLPISQPGGLRQAASGSLAIGDGHVWLRWHALDYRRQEVRCGVPGVTGDGSPVERQLCGAASEGAACRLPNGFRCERFSGAHAMNRCGSGPSTDIRCLCRLTRGILEERRLPSRRCWPPAQRSRPGRISAQSVRDGRSRTRCIPIPCSIPGVPSAHLLRGRLDAVFVQHRSFASALRTSITFGREKGGRTDRVVE